MERARLWATDAEEVVMAMTPDESDAIVDILLMSDAYRWHSHQGFLGGRENNIPAVYVGGQWAHLIYRAQLDLRDSLAAMGREPGGARSRLQCKSTIDSRACSVRWPW